MPDLIRQTRLPDRPDSYTRTVLNVSSTQQLKSTNLPKVELGAQNINPRQSIPFNRRVMLKGEILWKLKHSTLKGS